MGHVSHSGRAGFTAACGISAGEARFAFYCALPASMIAGSRILLSRRRFTFGARVCGSSAVVVANEYSSNGWRQLVDKRPSKRSISRLSAQSAVNRLPRRLMIGRVPGRAAAIVKRTRVNPEPKKIGCGFDRGKWALLFLIRSGPPSNRFHWATAMSSSVRFWPGSARIIIL